MEYLKEEYGIDSIDGFEEIRTMELGHIFQLGTRYSEMMNGKFTDKDGKDTLYYMGCYGIGVSRTLAALYEECLLKDKNEKPCGFYLPKKIAPFKVQIIPKMDDEEKVKIAEEIYDVLNKEGIQAILDDRENINIGSKIKDSKVLGTPNILVIGDKTDGNVLELENNKTGEKLEVTRDDLVRVLKK